MANKKCVFPKMGTKKIPRNRKSKRLTYEEKYNKIKEWKSWW
jgi:hypothetical protein